MPQVSSLLLATWLFCGLVASAAAQPMAFTLEAEINLGEEITAVAVNADEALIAAAHPSSDGEQIVLLDRRSRAPLGSIRTEVGELLGLRFAPDQDLLLVQGTQALELWRVPIASLTMDQPLPESDRLWRQPFDPELAAADEQESSVPAAGFLAGAGLAVWSEGRTVLGRGLSTDAPAPREGLFRGGRNIVDLAPHPSRADLAVAIDGDKRVLRFPDAFEPGPPGAQPDPEAWSLHRFPIAALAYGHDGELVSLDRGRNTVRWNPQGESDRIDFLEQLPESGHPREMIPLERDRWLLIWEDEGETSLRTVEGAPGRVAEAFPIPALPRSALSPTARYLALAEDETLKLYTFDRPLSPAAYVRDLRGLGAGDVALNYVRMLDPRNVSETQRRAADQELAQAPPESIVSDLLRRLRDALITGDPDQVAAAAQQVLARNPEHPEALQALRQLQELRDRRRLVEAQQAFDGGAYRRSIDLLSGEIDADSPFSGEAAVLIAKAEFHRDLESLLSQARQKMEMGFYGAAETLLNEVLRQDENNIAALGLQEELDRRTGPDWSTLLAMLLGALFALSIMGVLVSLFRNRRSTAGSATAATGPRVARRVRPAQRRSPHRAAGTAARPGSTAETERNRNAGRALGAAVRYHEASERLQQAQETLRLAKLADRTQHHTAFLLEVEAELNTLERRLNDQTADPQQLLKRITAIRGELRALRFEKPYAENTGPPSKPQPAEDLDYYSLLQVPIGARNNEIKSAYKLLIKEYHPDRHNASEFGWVRQEAERVSRQLGEAYRVLSDASLRAEYDRDLARKRGGKPRRYR